MVRSHRIIEKDVLRKPTFSPQSFPSSFSLLHNPSLRLLLIGSTHWSPTRICTLVVGANPLTDSLRYHGVPFGEEDSPKTIRKRPQPMKRHLCTYNLVGASSLNENQSLIVTANWHDELYHGRRSSRCSWVWCTELASGG